MSAERSTIRALFFGACLCLGGSGIGTGGIDSADGDTASGDGGVTDSMGLTDGGGSMAAHMLPPTTACDVLNANWPDEWVAFEDEVLEETNLRRAQSNDCRTGGQFPPARPLEAHPLLRCAARRHTLDMVQRNFFDHLDPDGQGPDIRVGATGYEFRAMGENIAAGAETPRAVVDGWMNSDGHCRNIMQGVFEQLGVGYVKKPTDQFKHYWTQVFGTP